VQPDLLTWVAAPTTSGPRSEASDGTRAKATSRERWGAFATAHPAIAAAIRDRAEAQAAAGERVSAKALTEWARATYRVSLNNSSTAGMAAWLIEQRPPLASHIERRIRK
jgi:hypothetical protein